jgi:hypothetical protein
MDAAFALMYAGVMSNVYTCLTCGAAIPLDDINVAADVALCRKCGNTSAFSLLHASAGLSSAGTGDPPRGIRIERDFMGGGVTLTCKRISPIAFFLIPFTALWSGVSMFGIYGSQIMKRAFDWKMSLAGLPFLLGTVVLLSVILMALFGKRQITLRHGSGTVFHGVGRIGWTRRFTYSREARVAFRKTNIHHNKVPYEEIVVTGPGTAFGLCATVPDELKRFIAGWLQREIARGS